MSMIEVANLEKYYGNHHAVQGISFSADVGEVIGLLGLNGAGKSTTMNMMTGCLAATSGTVTIDGIDVAKDPQGAKRSIGYLPEIPPLYVDMTVIAYLDFLYDLKKIKGNRAQRKEHLAHVCQQAGLTEVSQRLIRNLSKGYRQRVGLAGALVGNPKVLVLDEPTVGLDPTQTIEIRKLIAQLGTQHTVILSSHILSEIAAVCGRVVVIHQGVIVADDTPEHLEATMQNRTSCLALIEGEPQVVKPVLQAIPALTAIKRLEEREPGVWAYQLQGTQDADLRRPLFFALAQHNLPLLGVGSAQVSLEDVFLQLVQPQEGGDAP